MARSLVLLVALVMICGLAYLTLSVAVSEGVDVLVVVSFAVLLVLGFGVLGALTAPPDDR